MAKLTEQKILEWVDNQPLPEQVKLFYTLKEQICKAVEGEKQKKQNEIKELDGVIEGINSENKQN